MAANETVDSSDQNGTIMIIQTGPLRGDEEAVAEGMVTEGMVDSDSAEQASFVVSLRASFLLMFQSIPEYLPVSLATFWLEHINLTMYLAYQ